MYNAQLSVPNSDPSLIERLKRFADPRRSLDLLGLEIFEKTRFEQLIRALRLVGPALVVMHLGLVVLFRLLPSATERHAAFHNAMIQLNLVTVPFVLAVLAAISAKREVVRKSAVRRALVDSILLFYPLFGAVVTWLGQPIDGGYTFYVACVFSTAFAALEPLASIVSHGIAVAIAVIAIHRGHPDITSRIASETTAIGCAIFAFTLSRFYVRALVGQASAMAKVSRSNAELAEQVALQVGEIVQKVEQIEKLNDELDAQVRKRSRELSAALVMLAHRASAPITLTDGAIVGGRFIVEAKLDSSGMRFLAVDRSTQKRVVLKIAQAGSAGQLDAFQRFLRETELLASIRHPTVVRTIYVDLAEDGRLFHAVEFVAGQSLQDFQKEQGTLDPIVVARLAALLSDGLAAAHERSVVHRDIKPKNILLSPFSPGVRIIDFAAARLKDDGVHGKASTGHWYGTPEYMAPELLADPGVVDGKADVYSLGTVLYECLSGRLPYTASHAAGWLRAHAVESPKPLEELIPDVPSKLSQAVMSCLTKDPTARPSAKQLADIFQALCVELSSPTIDSFVRTAGEPRAARSHLRAISQ